MVTQKQKKERKRLAKIKKEEAEKLRLENEDLEEEEEEEEEDYEEEEEEETDDYVSPLSDIFDNVIEIGNNVLGVHDRANDRIYLDINYGSRKGVSSTGKTVQIANATYPIEEKMKLSLNVYDKQMTRSESKEANKIIDALIEEKKRKDKLKALKD